MFWNRPAIEFYCHPDHEGIIPEPKPASKFIPDWYKRIPAFSPSPERDPFGKPIMTVKKCMPVLDAMSLGYVMPLTGDVTIRIDETGEDISAVNPPGFQIVDWHSTEQIGGAKGPGAPTRPIKFLNPWVIKTKPGWSTLIMPLLNPMGPQHFTCIAGLVDTDTYPKEINFPAVWHTRGAEVSLLAGHPLVVVVPIKRSAVPRKPAIRKMSKAEFKRIKDIGRMQDTRAHVYTNELREPR